LRICIDRNSSNLVKWWEAEALSRLISRGTLFALSDADEFRCPELRRQDAYW
jgi:hypothetical protein